MERFWRKVKKTESCWLWSGATTRGCGVFRINMVNEYAHRFSWIMANGEIPRGNNVLRSCGEPLCVRPDHMRLSTSGQGPRPRHVAERFWEKVDKTNGCWLWRGTARGGRGSFGVRAGDTRMAHRFSWELSHGPIPDGPDTCVCHHCDNPLCVRPDHLFLGSKKDNTRDMLAKGRHLAPPGEANGRSKLKTCDVLSILEDYRSGAATQADLAKRHHMSLSAIRCVVLGITWRHVEL